MTSPELEAVSLSDADPGAPSKILGAGASIRWSILFAVLAMISAHDARLRACAGAAGGVRGGV